MNDSIDASRVQGIVFDLYHTLIHITAKVDPYRRLLRALELSHGRIEKQRRTLMTQTVGSKLDIAKRFAPNVPVPDYDFDHDLLVELNSCRVYPETRDVLRQLRGRIPLFLLSNITSHYKSPFYRLGLEIYFDQVFFSCDMGAIKPEAAIFEQVSLATGISAEHLLMIGDSPKSDFLGSRAAGWQALLLDRTDRWSHTPRIQSLTALGELF